MPDGKVYELVKGQLVERNISLEASALAGRILTLIALFADEERFGIRA